jgi:predicted RNase H-like nuclease (RuvC/YqgF family)
VSITSNSSVDLHAHCTKEIRELQDAMLGLVDRVDAAEAEIERLRAALKQAEAANLARVLDNDLLAEANAEIERLRETIAEWQEIHGTFSGDVHRACQAEIERLRAVLERIATDDFEDSHARWAAEALGPRSAS